MPVWVVLQIALDIGLVAVILWLSWQPRTAMAKQRVQLAGLLQSAEVKTAQLHILLQRAEDVLRVLRETEVNNPRASSAPPLLPASPYEEAARLAQQGYTVDEIASRVSLPREEIGLIIRLKKASKRTVSSDE